MQNLLRMGICRAGVGNRRPRISDRNIEDVRSLFENNPRISIRQAVTLLNMLRSTIQQVHPIAYSTTHTKCKISMEVQTQTT